MEIDITRYFLAPIFLKDELPFSFSFGIIIEVNISPCSSFVFLEPNINSSIGIIL